MFEHIGLQINRREDIDNFYVDILNFRVVKENLIPQEWSRRVFNIDSETPIVLVKKEGLALEFFITEEQNPKGYNHISIKVKDRERLVEMARDRGYETIRIEREFYDLIFIKDSSNNILEIKEE